MKKEFWVLDSFGRKIFGPFWDTKELLDVLPPNGKYRISENIRFDTIKNTFFDIDLKFKNANVTLEQQNRIEEHTYQYLDKISEVIRN